MTLLDATADELTAIFDGPTVDPCEVRLPPTKKLCPNVSDWVGTLDCGHRFHACSSCRTAMITSTSRTRATCSDCPTRTKVPDIGWSPGS